MIGLVMLGCGSGANRPCAESMRARADGKYGARVAQPWGTTWNGAEQAYETYGRSCQQGCNRAKDANQCVELGLLEAEGYQSGSGVGSAIKGKQTLVGYCDQGYQLACEWVEANRDVLRRLGEYEVEAAARAEAERKAAEAAEAAEAGTPIGGAVKATKQQAAGMGYRLLSDSTQSLAGTGYAAFNVSFERGVGYMYVLIAASTTRFTASLGAANAERMLSFATLDLGAGVFAMGLSFTPAESDSYSPFVEIKDAGGDQGTVRVLLFSR